MRSLTWASFQEIVIKLFMSEDRGIAVAVVGTVIIMVGVACVLSCCLSLPDNHKIKDEEFAKCFKFGPQGYESTTVWTGDGPQACAEASCDDGEVPSPSVSEICPEPCAGQYTQSSQSPFVASSDSSTSHSLQFRSSASNHESTDRCEAPADELEMDGQEPVSFSPRSLASLLQASWISSGLQPIQEDEELG